MPLRRRAWLTTEGWYYLAVLAFIVGGAILRSVNLLVVLAGMMLATLLFNWRLVMAGLTGLVVRRKLPEQILAGEPLTVEISVLNSRWWMSSWLVTVEDWVERVEVWGSGVRGHKSAASGRRESPGGAAPHSRRLWRKIACWLNPTRLWHFDATRAVAVIAHVPARGQAIGTYRITLHRRGRYRFGPLRVSTRFPLGLVRGQITLPEYAELIVSPRLGRLLPDWARLLEAELVGDQRHHPQRGISDGDYYGLRPWQSGDSLRWVHWRTTAKLGRPVVRQYERRRSRDVALVLDPWLAEHPEPCDEGFAELSISLAATAVTDVTSRGHSRLTFAIAGRQPQCYSGPASAIFCQEILAMLAELPSQGDYLVANTLLQALDDAPHGARLIVISPRPSDAPSLAASMTDLPIDPQDMLWIDTSSEQLQTLFVLE